jgi:hypothetical protein
MQNLVVVSLLKVGYKLEVNLSIYLLPIALLMPPKKSRNYFSSYRTKVLHQKMPHNKLLAT